MVRWLFDFSDALPECSLFPLCISKLLSLGAAIQQVTLSHVANFFLVAKFRNCPSDYRTILMIWPSMSLNLPRPIHSLPEASWTPSSWLFSAHQDTLQFSWPWRPLHSVLMLWMHWSSWYCVINCIWSDTRKCVICCYVRKLLFDLYSIQTIKLLFAQS